jgi:putative glutamine amidotransferase
MLQPFIGITTYGRDEHQLFSLPAAYVDAVRRAGGIPVLIPPGERHLTPLMNRLDGLILAGGGDIDPIHYNGEHHETIYMVDAERDLSELAMVRRVLDDGLPTLGICRGIQVINVALGGTLVEHLPDEVGDEVAHRLPPRKPGRHLVAIQPDSRLAGIVATQQVEAASWHHQAIRHTAPGLSVVAHAPDGAIEATEADGHPWLVAVQWHPELTAADDPAQQRLFDALVEAARQKALARGTVSG